MKRIIFLFTVILYQNSFAQTNNKIDFFVFDNGSLKQKNGSTNSLSTAGQSIIGTSKGNNNIIITGFSPELIFSNIITSSEGEDNIQPKDFSLFQNYPNPFNPSTTIEYALPSESNVKIAVFNILGEKVAELVNTQMHAGVHTINFDAGSLASGIYIYRIEARILTGQGNFVDLKKMMLLK
jgi:hypothetical protein